MDPKEEDEEMVLTNLRPNEYNGAQIGQFRVLSDKYVFCVIPRQYCITMLTFSLIFGPTVFQMAHVSVEYSRV